MKKVYAVVDTNVLVSALLSSHNDSATSQVLSLLVGGWITPLYNEEILVEYADVLHREKFNFSDEDIKLILTSVIEFGIESERLTSREIFPDPKDVVFYEVALSTDGTFLVTGNTKHFPKNPIVVTPAELVSIIKGN